jgi:hypothetical protein
MMRKCQNVNKPATITEIRRGGTHFFTFLSDVDPGFEIDEFDVDDEEDEFETRRGVCSSKVGLCSLPAAMFG